MAAPSRRPPIEYGLGELFDQVRDAVVVSDTEGSIVLWNPAAEALFGHTLEEALGANVRMLVPVSYQARHDAGMKRFRASGHGPLVDTGMMLELPSVHKDGRQLVVEMRLSLLTAKGGHVMAVIRDATERVRVAAEREAERQRLRAANEALEAFAYVVGHDLKEPVRAVDAYLDALGEHVDEQEARVHLARATSANERVGTLLSGLIEWSRATLGGIDLVPLRVDEVAASDPCMGRYQPAMDERGARLTFEGDFSPVLATNALLCQVFGNLVLNAIRHNPRPSPLVVISQEKTPEGMALVRIRDNGPGFPHDVVHRVTDPIAGRTRVKSETGAGFGLTIAKRAIESLGGRMEVASTPEGGEARLWFTLA